MYVFHKKIRFFYFFLFIFSNGLFSSLNDSSEPFKKKKKNLVATADVSDLYQIKMMKVILQFLSLTDTHLTFYLKQFVITCSC